MFAFIRSKINSIMPILANDRYLLFCVIIFMGVYTYPIILANVPYIDGIGSTLYGRNEWIHNARPLASLWAILIEQGKATTNIAPLPLLIGLLILTLGMVVYANKCLIGLKAVDKYLILVSVIINTFLLENISYIYDSLWMIGNMGLALLLVSYNEKNILPQ